MHTGPRQAAVALGYVVAVALAGCSRFGGDPVRDRWEERANLPSCGDVRLQQGQTLARDARPAVACLRAALDSGAGAELRVRYPTTEGDPITAYYRVTPAGGTEIYEDSTHDEYSDKNWSFARCPHPESVLDVNC